MFEKRVLSLTGCAPVDRTIRRLFDETPYLKARFVLDAADGGTVRRRIDREIWRAVVLEDAIGRPDASITIDAYDGDIIFHPNKRVMDVAAVCAGRECVGAACAYFGERYRFWQVYQHHVGDGPPAYPVGTLAGARNDYAFGYLPEPTAAIAEEDHERLEGHVISVHAAVFDGEIGWADCDIAFPPDLKAADVGAASCLILLAGVLETPRRGVHYFFDEAGDIHFAPGLFDGLP